MADVVENAIYRMSVEGTEEIDAAAKAVDRLTVADEKNTRATRTNADAMEKLLGRVDPLVRAHQRLQQEIQQSNRLQQEGVGTTAQHAQVMAAATARYNNEVQRLSGTKAADTFLGAGNAAKLSAFQIQNLSFQMQDMGQAIATGQPLFTTFIQQGSQIAQIFGPGVGVAAAVKAVGTGIMSFLLNPLNLAVLAFAAAAAGAQLFYRYITDGSQDTEQLLERHKELVDQVKDAYDAAGGSADNWRAKIIAATGTEVTDNLKQQKTLLQEAMEALEASGSWAGGLFGNAVDPFTVLLGQAGKGFREEVEALRALNDAASEGAIDVEQYRRELDAIGSRTKSEAVREFTAELIRNSAGAVDAANRVREAEDAFDVMNGTLKDTPSFLKLVEDGFKKSGGAAGEMSKATSEAVKEAKAAAQAAMDLNDTLGEQDREKFGALNALNTELREAQKNLKAVEDQLRSAGSADTLNTMFPEASKIEGANQALKDSITTMDLLFDNLEQGAIAPEQVAAEIERIRAALVDMGLNSNSVDKLVDTFIAAAQRAMALRDTVEVLSEALRNIPDVDVQIRYHITTTGGAPGTVTTTYPEGTDMSTVGFNKQEYPGGINVYRPNDAGGGIEVPYGGGLTGFPQPRPKAAGGPVSAGQTYLVGEEGPEIVTMAGAGNVSTASSTASVLSGGANVLRSIEENTFLTVEEIRRVNGYLETLSVDWKSMLDSLDGIRSMLRTAGSSSAGGSSGGGGGGFSSGTGGGFSSGGTAAFSHNNPSSPYYYNPRLSYAGGALYDPISDYIFNGNAGALGAIAGAPKSAYESWGGPSAGTGLGGMPVGYNPNAELAKALREQYGFATGGYIAPGDSQRVQFFKRPDEAVGIFRPEQREAVGRAIDGGRSKTVNMGGITINVSAQGGELSPRSVNQMRDALRRAVHSAAGDL